MATFTTPYWLQSSVVGYVDDVLRRADEYATAPAGGNVGSGDASAVLNNPNITLCSACRQDLIDGMIDQRVIDFLAWAGQRGQVAVSVLKTGHSQFVAGTNRVSNHWEGRAADLYAIDGEEGPRPVRPAAPSPRRSWLWGTADRPRWACRGATWWAPAGGTCSATAGTRITCTSGGRGTHDARQPR
jgi:hypothetical protein